MNRGKKGELRTQTVFIQMKNILGEKQSSIFQFNEFGCKNNQLINSIHTVHTTLPIAIEFIFFFLVYLKYGNIIQFGRSDIENK